MKTFLLTLLLVSICQTQIRSFINPAVRNVQSLTKINTTPSVTPTPPATDTSKSFSEYMTTFSSRYSINNDNNFRALIFAQNLQTIQKVNTNPTLSYKLGINQFTGLSQSQFEKYALGELPEQPRSVSTANLRIAQSDVQTVNTVQANNKKDDAVEGSVGAESAFTVKSASLNLAYVSFLFNAPWDWRGVGGALTSVKDQGFCGSCYSFAAVGVVQAMYMIENAAYFPNLSEQQIVDCSSENSGCDGGWRDKAMNYIKNNGLVSQSTYPYTAVKGSCKYSSGTWKISSVTLHSGCIALRAAVRKGPIAVGVAASSWSGYASGIYKCPSTGNVNHAVILVGYTNLRHWIIKNSWGTSWGANGYIVIDQDANCKICERDGVGARVN